MTIAAKPTGYTVNTGHTHCPDHLWMMDGSDVSTGTVTDQGKSATNYNLTISGADWATDTVGGSSTDVLSFVAANLDSASNASISGLTGVQVVAVITKCVAGAGTRAMATLCDPTQADRFVALVMQGDEDIEVLSRYDSTVVTNDTTLQPSFGYDMLAIRFSDTTVDVSVNGSAWETTAVSHSGLLAAITKFSLGGLVHSTPTYYWDDNIAAAMWWHGDKDAADIYATVSGSSWTFLSTSVKKLKLLAHHSAIGAGSIEGVVLNAARDTVIGEFTGQAFIDGSGESPQVNAGYAVLKVLATDISPDGSTLTTSDTPLAIAYNATYSTPLVACTVIEE